MCGIAGIIDLGGLADFDVRQSVQSMLGKMEHRGPDANSVYHRDRICLGHARLSIIDLSASANQPFTDRYGRYVIVFNGEIYNFLELKAQMKDCDFQTHGDTEVLVEGFARYGIGFVDRVKGMFAFAIWDRYEQKLWLCRDRMGVKPLYYVRGNGFLVFASEIRSIIASTLVAPRLSRTALFSYLKYQSASSHHCMIEGVQELQPGNFLEIGINSKREGQYWSILSMNITGDTSRSQVARSVRELFFKAVERRLVADVSVGAFLSGGIDSSAVVAVMSKVMSERPVTFNISFTEGRFDESFFARMVADKYGTEHHEILVKERNFLDALIPAMDAMDTPSGDGVNTYVVSKAVKENGITVALSGVGGDELFAGYRHFKTFYWIKKMGWLWRTSAGMRKKAIPPSSKLGELFSISSDMIAEIYPVLRQVASNEVLMTVLQGLEVHDSIQESLLREQERLNAFPYFSQYSIAEYLGYTQQTLLKDADQMSMAVSLELREPFFDHELVEYVLGLPDQLKYPHRPKQLFIDAVGDLLPKEVIDRPKQGFAFPWPVWMRGDLSGFCEMHINRMSQREFVNGSELLKRWKRFKEGDGSVKWMELWLFVTLNYWMERNGVS